MIGSYTVAVSAPNSLTTLRALLTPSKRIRYVRKPTGALYEECPMSDVERGKIPDELRALHATARNSGAQGLAPPMLLTRRGSHPPLEDRP